MQSEEGSGVHGIEPNQLDLYIGIQAIRVGSQIWHNGRSSFLYYKHGLIIYSHF
jgi:hypothetical protein